MPTQEPPQVYGITYNHDSMAEISLKVQWQYLWNLGQTWYASVSKEVLGIIVT